MSSNSDRSYTLPSSSPLPSLCAPPTSTPAPQNPDPDSKKITSSHQMKRLKISTHSESHCRKNYATMVDMLPDELLLHILDQIRLSEKFRHIPVWKWHVLVHVCRRWRRIVFASPLRLDLQLLCTYGTPVRKYLACWPALPIVVDYNTIFGQVTPDDEENIITALEHCTRIRQINIKVSSSLWSKMATVMQHPFPALTSLWISALNENVPLLLPIGFLGGSAPGLREIWFQPTPTLPTVLSYTSDLVKLYLMDSDTLD
ncbi:hypothetical protein V8E53_011158 [Lactarius tabidus]